MKKLNSAMNSQSDAARKAKQAAADHAAAMGQTSLATRQAARYPAALSADREPVRADRRTASEGRESRGTRRGRIGGGSRPAECADPRPAVQDHHHPHQQGGLHHRSQPPRTPVVLRPACLRRAGSRPVTRTSSVSTAPNCSFPRHVRDHRPQESPPTARGGGGGHLYVTIQRLESNDPAKWVSDLNKLAKQRGGKLGVQGVGT